MSFSITRLVLTIIIAANAANLANLIEQSWRLITNLGEQTLGTTLTLASTLCIILIVTIHTQNANRMQWLSER
ncbi:MAG: hypothetical protein HY868_03785 [Chloroflexi bacterium]|nr:hypothetical protein [Chloroflexota bacterium]